MLFQEWCLELLSLEERNSGLSSPGSPEVNAVRGLGVHDEPVVPHSNPHI